MPENDTYITMAPPSPEDTALLALAQQGLLAQCTDNELFRLRELHFNLIQSIENEKAEWERRKGTGPGTCSFANAYVIYAASYHGIDLT